VVFTPAPTYSGKTTVEVAVTTNGVTQEVAVPVTVSPTPVPAASVSPTSIGTATLDWKASPNAGSYTVYVNGKPACTTSGTTCTPNVAIGPASKITIVSDGGDQTTSQVTTVKFVDKTPVPVSATTMAASGALSPAALSSLATGLEKSIALGYLKILMVTPVSTGAVAKNTAKSVGSLEKILDASSKKKSLDFVVSHSGAKTGSFSTYAEQ
jgi:hypothetical protein